MRIHIRPHASDLYVVTCYLSPSVGRAGLNRDWRETLKKVEDRWLTVETDYLFTDQFNTAATGDISGLRIMNHSVDAIEDDAREHPTYLMVDWLKEHESPYLRDFATRFPSVAFEEKRWKVDLDSAVKILRKYVDQVEPPPFPTEDIDWRIVTQTLYGMRHHCRPIVPITNPIKVYFNTGRGSYYTEAWFKATFPGVRYRRGF